MPVGKKLTIEYVKQKTKKLANGYVCLDDEYIKAKSKLKFICDKNHIFYKSWDHFQRGQRCSICTTINQYSRMTGKRNPNWKGGYYRNGLPLYSTYATQIEFCEQVRYNPKNNNLLQVRCTELSCRKWFTPNVKDVEMRIQAINSNNRGESRFYCSNKCKQNCSIYGQSSYPKGFINKDNIRIDQNDWAKLVKDNDNYICQRCGAKYNLVAHHIEGLNQNPIMSADIDIGITFCKNCDKKAHSEIGCRKIDLTKRNLCNDQ